MTGIFCWLIFCLSAVVVVDGFLVKSASPKSYQGYYIFVDHKESCCCHYAKFKSATDEKGGSATATTLNKFDIKWLEKYDSLKEYRNEHGHCNVPRYHPALSRWVPQQRMQKKKNLLRQDRIDLLNEIDFCWELPKGPSSAEQTWNEQYQKLISYRKLHGHCNVPTKGHGSLGTWVNTQRVFFKRKLLRPDRIDRLNEIGFQWRVRHILSPIHDEKWLQKYENLKAFRHEYGHLSVPRDHGPLGSWVSHQRRLKETNGIRQDREDLLNSIGFVGQTDAGRQRRDRQWLEKYEELKSYQNEHGHCLVPSKRSSLGNWIQHQRSLSALGSMREDRRDLLNQLGFVWNQRNRTPWIEKYEELKSFKKEHGHCLVPKTSSTDTLRTWVQNQRASFARGSLRQDKKDLLDEIGFVWKLRNRT